MARSLTNNFTLAYGKQSAKGVDPTIWFLLEPNTIGTFGSTITTVPRAPISKNRQRRKGTTTDLDSAVEFEHDLTLQAALDFMEGYCFATANGFPEIQAGAGFQSLAADNDPPPAGTDSGYTHSALTGALPANTLLFARGFTTVANNGFKVVIAGSTTTATLISTALVDETPTQVSGARVDICGRRAATSDLTLTVTGTTGVLGSTLLDFTTLNLTVGQNIHVGGLTSANWFNGTIHGHARITSIAATALGLDKLDAALVTDGGVGDTVDILYGQFIRNVTVDDADFIEQYFTFEGTYANLENPGPGDEYEYPLDNLCNTMAFALPLTDKATIAFGFVGTDTAPPSTTQKTGADAPVEPVQTEALNTSADILRLRITEVDETGLTTDFKSATLTLNNNVSGEKVLGFLGSKYLNTGIFEVNLEAQILFTEGGVIDAIRANDTLTMDFIIKNDDGGLSFDIPSLTLGGGGREFPVNETILCNLTGEAFEDETLGYSIGISTFPCLPA